MPRIDKGKYSNKQKRKTEHIKDGFEKRGGLLTKQKDALEQKLMGEVKVDLEVKNYRSFMNEKRRKN